MTRTGYFALTRQDRARARRIAVGREDPHDASLIGPAHRLILTLIAVSTATTLVLLALGTLALAGSGSFIGLGEPFQGIPLLVGGLFDIIAVVRVIKWWVRLHQRFRLQGWR